MQEETHTSWGLSSPVFALAITLVGVLLLPLFIGLPILVWGVAAFRGLSR